MKNKIQNCLVLICLLFSGCRAPAQNNIVQIPLGDIGLAPQTNVLITVKLLGTFPNIYNGTWINPIRTQYSDTTGTGWFTNLIPGNYASYAQGYPGYVPFAVQTNTTGTVGISQLTTPYLTPNPGTNTVSLLQLEAILAAALTINNATGTNVNLQGIFNGVNQAAMLTNHESSVAFDGPLISSDGFGDWFAQTVSATLFLGSGGSLTSLNASQVLNGTLPYSVLPLYANTNGASIPDTNSGGFVTTAQFAGAGHCFFSNTLTAALVLATITNGGSWMGMMSNKLVSVYMTNNTPHWTNVVSWQ